VLRGCLIFTKDPLKGDPPLLSSDQKSGEGKYMLEIMGFFDFLGRFAFRFIQSTLFFGNSDSNGQKA
jgi:hypothetical protein